VKTSGNKYKNQSHDNQNQFAEILQALTSQTTDDASVIESLDNIFSSYRVRFGQKLAPVRVNFGNPRRHGPACT
jgi:hypothetical protein